MRKLLAALLTVGCLFIVHTINAAANGRHVVVMVWDGMRPDFITEEYSPTLFKLAQTGVWFDNHHPVYPSSTEVNGTAIATGAYPAHDGVIGNKDFQPPIDPLKSYHTEDIADIRKGDAVTHGHYVRVPTVAELLRKKGMHTAVAGAKPVALLHDRLERAPDADYVTVFAGNTVPPEALARLTNLYGNFPGTKNTNVTRNDWTTTALIDGLWTNGVPEFSVLWMNEPDASQHQSGPGSERALAGIKNADDNLARVIAALEKKGVRNSTDILVCSDHGFSTILSTVDVAESLKSAGFNATREFKSAPTKGSVMVVGNGAYALLYVTGHDQKTIAALTKYFEGWPYTGVIFTRDGLPGTFTLAQAHVDSTTAPDILLSLRWNADKSDNGTPGLLVTDISGYGPGQGMHGSLSHFDMHNTFVANGPDFRPGIVDHLATGNSDIAPTVLAILGVRKPKSMDGRAVTEAMTIGDSKIKSYQQNRLEATNDLGGKVWHQYLSTTEVNGTTYYDEGNGAQAAK